jgi:hypothetical protein
VPVSEGMDAFVKSSSKEEKGKKDGLGKYKFCGFLDVTGCVKVLGLIAMKYGRKVYLKIKLFPRQKYMSVLLCSQKDYVFVFYINGDKMQLVGYILHIKKTEQEL